MAMAMVRSTAAAAVAVGTGLPSLVPSCRSDWEQAGARRVGGVLPGTLHGKRRAAGREMRRRPVGAIEAVIDPHSMASAAAAAAIGGGGGGGGLDLHSFAFLGELFDLSPQLDPSKLSVNPIITREIFDEKSNWELGEQAIKNFYMAYALVFCWGCCVFGSMNDKFYESDGYRNAGGNGTGHWIYDQEEREEAAARDEMWSEDLMKEIEEKAEAIRAEEKEREKELV